VHKDLSEKITDLKITSLLSQSTIAELRVLVNGIRAYANNDEALMFQGVKSHIQGSTGRSATSRFRIISARWRYGEGLDPSR
jgi:hypothetical protein